MELHLQAVMASSGNCSEQAREDQYEVCFKYYYKCMTSGAHQSCYFDDDV